MPESGREFGYDPFAMGDRFCILDEDKGGKEGILLRSWVGLPDGAA